MPVATLLFAATIATGAETPVASSDGSLRLHDTAGLSLAYAPAEPRLAPMMPWRRQDTGQETGLDTGQDPSRADPPEEGDEKPLQTGDEIPAPLLFGTAGTTRWEIHGGMATDFTRDDNNFGLVDLGFSHFFSDGLALNVNLDAMYFKQRGDDTQGAQLSLLLRYHFLRERTWSMYGDVGLGLLGTGDHVPFDGSGFNFTPQAGVGFTFELSGEDRLILGFRWVHISNANTFTDNPGRDSVMAYLGVSFPY